LLVLLVFGSIETCNAIFLKQSLQTAAYEAMRVAVKEGATTVEAAARGAAILDQREVQNFQIRFTPNDVVAARRGDELKVDVSAHLGSNATLARLFAETTHITSSLVMSKE
jgi:Flp pilus assembly protein TadG